MTTLPSINILQQLTKSRGVRNDCLVKIIVGEGDQQQTFHLQHTLFVKTSAVFAATSRNETLGGGEAGVYRFPQDSVGAWEILIYWMIKATLPESKFEEQHEEEEAQLLLVQCWVLGDKYNIAAFQDVIMLELLFLISGISMDPMSAAFATNNTPPGSKLRHLVANEIVFTVYSDYGRAIGAYDEALAATGFASEAMSGLDKYRDGTNGINVDYVGEKNGAGRTQEWRKYMVNERPPQHWVLNHAGVENEE